MISWGGGGEVGYYPCYLHCHWADSQVQISPLSGKYSEAPAAISRLPLQQGQAAKATHPPAGPTALPGGQKQPSTQPETQVGWAARLRQE
jgi:hypothetical protein